MEVGKEEQISVAVKERTPGWMYYGIMEDPVQDPSPEVSEKRQAVKAAMRQSRQDFTLGDPAMEQVPVIRQDPVMAVDKLDIRTIS